MSSEMEKSILEPVVPIDGISETSRKQTWWKFSRNKNQKQLGDSEIDKRLQEPSVSGTTESSRKWSWLKFSRNQNQKQLDN